jgi:hypothetical protein
MEIIAELANDITQHPDPAREALEAVPLAGYRSGKLTSYQAGRLLGLGSRFEFEALLKTRGIYDHAYGPRRGLGYPAEARRRSQQRGPRAGALIENRKSKNENRASLEATALPSGRTSRSAPTSPTQTLRAHFESIERHTPT